MPKTPFHSLTFLQFLLGLVLLGWSTIVEGQSMQKFIFQHFNVEDGLSNNWISDIYQDENNYLWIGTQYGVNRYDGKDFVQYTYNPNPTKGLSGNWVRAITENQNGQLLFSNYGAGINTYNLFKNSFSTHSLTSISTNPNVRKLLSTRKGQTFIASNKGLLKWGEDDQVTPLDQYNIQDIAQHQNDLLIALKSKGLFIRRINDDKEELVSSGLDVTGVQTIGRDSILAFEKEILYLYKSNRQGAWEKVALNIAVERLNNQHALPFVYRTLNGSIFTTGINGIWELSADLKKRTFHSMKNFFPELINTKINAHCFLEDHEGNYWLGTNQGLLQLNRPKPFVHQKLNAHGDPLPRVREISSLDSSYFFALPNKLITWDANKNEPPHILINEHFLSLHIASDQMLYTVSETTKPKKLLKINPTTLAISKLSLPDSEKPYSSCWKITEDQKQRLWISLWNQLICYDLKTGQSFPVTSTLEKNLSFNILDIIIDRQDRLWIASIKSGLLRIDNISTLQKGESPQVKGYQYDPTNEETIICDLVQQLFEAQDSTIWVSTDGGLNHFYPEEERFERFLRDADMVDDKIMGITQDDTGILWMSTISHGILSFDPSIRRFQNFNKSDGLPGNSMMISSVFQDKEGRIWMGSESGLISYFPEQVNKEKTYHSSLLWEELQLVRESNTEIITFPGKNKQQKITIPPTVQAAQFQFSYPAFQESDNILYRFRLEGYHSSWLPPQSQGLLTLAKLPPGNYRLNVEVLARGRKAVATYTPIEISVLAPWYASKWAYGLYAMISLGFIYLVYRIQIQRRLALAEQQRSEEIVAEKIKWFQKIAHEFRTPLTIIFGAVDQLRSTKTSNNKINYSRVEQIADQATHLTRQIDEILELAKIQEGSPKLHLEQGEFIAFQHRLLRAHQHLADQKKIKLQFKSNIPEIHFAFDIDKWHKITGNLINNAIKFSQEGDEVILDIKVSEEPESALLILQVQDTGTGISQKLLPHLFEPFRQAEAHQEQGTGLGLALTKALVELHGGTIKAESTQGTGSTFTIKLPITMKVDLAKKVLAANNNYLKEASDAKVLIAEDHPEILAYIESCLQDRYQILSAKDGLEAWELCQKHLPDLVLSDVMMPGRSGIELSRMIRSDKRTNHIPLILLTAKSGNANRMEGLEAGADEYLTKPFQRRELELRIERLLAYQQSLIEKYRSGDFSVQQSSKLSDTFMQSVVKIIQKKLDDEDFSVQVLADALHLNRVQVYRKIKALTEQTPTLFIRQIRLQTAHQLLQQSDQTIAEIAFQVGFKDPAYFSRVFAETYGAPPSSLR